MKGLSIITPTYNRAHLLGQCYDSLRKQTCFDFEWIIIDDGSTDNTKEAVCAFENDLFSIVFCQKENGGKHTALNASHPYIKGKYVLILDSDDFLVTTAVEEVINVWNRFEKNDKVGIVTFLKGSSENEASCNVDSENEYQPVDLIRVKRNCIYSSDCCEVIRVELFKQYPFPEYTGEIFVAESALWTRVGLTHQCVYINKVIYICDYHEGGLTKSGRRMRIRNPNGGMFTSNLGMSKRNYLKGRIKNGLLFTCYGCFAGYSPQQMAEKSDQRLLMSICLPFGYLMYKIWKKKYY